jgi:tetratricopeptide (TPR) repeat protein
MSKNLSLNDKIASAIDKLCEQGDNFMENDQLDLALAKYKEALLLIPEPITDWEASTWVLTAIGETYFFQEDYDNALSTLQNAMHCPDAIGNPLIHLRLGQVQFELGNEKKAQDELVRAYMGGGEEVFEDEKPKYFNLVKKILDL